MKKRAYVSPIFLLPSIVILAALTLFPFFFVVISSFTEYSKGHTIFVGLKHYQKILFSDIRFWGALKVSFVFTAGTVISEFIIALIISLILHDLLKGKGIIRSLIILPMAMVPIVIAAIYRHLIYNLDFGLANFLLGIIGIKGFKWISGANTALFSIILIDIWQWTPFMILILYAGLQAMATEPFEAAVVDGASRWQIFRYITFPLLKKAVLLALLFRIIDSLRTFDIILGTTEGGPGVKTESLNLYTYFKMFRFQEMGYASAMAVIFLIIIILIANPLIKQIISGEGETA